jgi:hypothetical protein
MAALKLAVADMKNRAFLALVGATLMLSGPAMAGDAVCLWKAQTQQFRDQTIANYAKGGLPALAISDRLPEGAPFDGCGVSPDKLTPALGSLTFYAAHLGAADLLTRKYNLKAERIDALWNSFDPARRERFERQVALQTTTDDAPPADPAVLRELMQKLSVSDAQMAGAVVDFISGRAIQHFREAQF